MFPNELTTMGSKGFQYTEKYTEYENNVKWVGSGEEN